MRPLHALTDLDKLKAPCARHILIATTIVVPIKFAPFCQPNQNTFYGPVVRHDVGVMLAAWCALGRQMQGWRGAIDPWRRSADVGALMMRFGQMAGFDRMASLKPDIKAAFNIVARRIPA